MRRYYPMLLLLITAFLWFGLSGTTGHSTLHAQAPMGELSTGQLTVSQITAGGEHTCLLTSAGGVRCWGANLFGQLGDDTFDSRNSPVSVANLMSLVQSIVAGGSHNCALMDNGGVRCWGWNVRGQLGDGTGVTRARSVSVEGLGSGVQALAAGGAHTCALTDAGAVKCWGYNTFGQVGDDTTSNKFSPADVVGLGSGVQAITADGGHTCALTDAGGVKCWGSNIFGQLGDGTTTDRHIPVDVVGLDGDVQAIAAGRYHTCALTDAGNVRCWGYNTFGQLSDGTPTGDHTMVNVEGLGSGVQAISAGGLHTCALTSAGEVRCWGRNHSGQLGDGTTTDRPTPMAVAGLGTGVQQIHAGRHHACALTEAGAAVKCWGANNAGQLGDGSTENRLTPVDTIDLFPSEQPVIETLFVPFVMR